MGNLFATAKPKQRIIFVATAAKNTMEFKFSDDAATWTVGQLKSKIHENEGIPPDQQRLIAPGASIESQDTERLDIYWETTFRLFLRLRNL